MRNRNSFKRHSGLKSYCDDITIKGTARYIQERWEDLSEQADKAGDRVASQRFKQQAEHYIKLEQGLV